VKKKKFFTLFIVSALIFSQVLIPINLKADAKTINDWDLVGTAGFSDGVALYTYLELDNNGDPYIVFQDKANDDKATVMKYNDNTSLWEVVGQKGFSDGLVRYTTLAFDSNNTPYVAYTDGDTYKATVKEFDGTNWVDVGSPRFSSGGIGYIKLAFNGDIPHVIYKDYSLGGKAVVMQYSSSNGWVAFAGASGGISDGEVESTDIEIIDSGDGFKIYAAYKDIENGDGITVKQNDDSFSFNWSDVGTPGFSDGELDGSESVLDLELDKDGIPYVAFVDKANGKEITVMKYNGSEWQVVGSKGFTEDGSPDYAEKPSFEINDNGDIYLSVIHDQYGDSSVVYKYTNSNSTWNKLGTDPITTSNYITNFTSLDIDSENNVYVGYMDGDNEHKASVMKYSDPADRKIDNKYISGIEPLIGEVPVKSIETSQYTGTITWSPNDTSFDYETVYTATINLTPKLGYKLEGVAENFFEVSGAEITANDANSGVVTAEFPITYANWDMVGGSFTDEYTDALIEGDSFYLGNLDIAVNNLGVLYVGFVYQVNTDGWKSAVKKYEDNQWVDIGSVSLPLNNYNYIQIEMGNDNYPIIAYCDKLGDLGNIDVKKWDGSSWQVIGDSSKIGSQDPKDFNFKVNGSTPYLSYSTFDSSSNYGSANVSKYDSAEGWINIGVDLSPGLSYKTNLAFDNKGNPYISYVAYMGEGVFYKHIIKQFKGDNWEILREYEGLEVGPSYHNDFIIDSNDNIYLAYVDYDSSKEVTVEKYNGTSWNVIGTKGFTDDGNENGVHLIDLELDSNDNPILSVDHNSYSMSQEGKYTYKYLTGIDKWIPLRSEYFEENLNDTNIDTYQNKAYLVYSTSDGLDYGHLLEYTPTESYTPPPTPSPRPSIPKLVIETDELPEGIEGIEYEYQLEGDGGREPYTWGAEGLPQGLEISEDGQISGIPEEAGIFNVKIELLDTRNYYRSKIIKLIIEEKEEVIENPETEIPADKPNFIDIIEHWISEYIDTIIERGIIFGYPDKTFKPDNKVTRGEFASMIIRTFEIDPIEGNIFDDTLDNWAESSINGAVERGIITGYEDNTFKPDEPITREEMAVMISRALNIEEEVVEEYFEDTGAASPWAQLSISRLGSRKILTGFPDGTFRPKDTLTRAEAVKVIYEILSDLDELQ
jgi:hypothetical protein